MDIAAPFPAWTVHHGDCIEIMRSLPDSSVDAIVTDPPYGLGFLGQTWDDLPPGEEWATECLRVLKPGGMIAAFGGTRTFHRLACAIEDAGFEIRDSIGYSTEERPGLLAWTYGSGFPKSLNVTKALEALPACSCGVASLSGEPMVRCEACGGVRGKIPQGLGTALKPAWEPIVLARKPLVGSVAANVLAHGTGALNIDACRVESNGDALTRGVSGGGLFFFDGFSTLAELEAAAAVGGTTPTGRDAAATLARFRKFKSSERTEPAARWPTNVVLDGHAADALDEQSGERPGRASQNQYSTKPKFRAGVNLSGSMAAQTGFREGYNDSGGASRFFPTFRYQAKAPARERPKVDGVAHNTVKPLELMRWLVRLVTPPGGVVLDPFAGSGTTVEAALLEGFACIAIEREADYLPLIHARIKRSRGSDDSTDVNCLPLGQGW